MKPISQTGLLAVAMLSAGCASQGPPVVLLMETPALYYKSAVDPYEHLDEVHRTTTVSVFYATNRMSRQSDALNELPYGNGISDELSLGQATVRFGDEAFSWEDLYRASVSPTREADVPLTLLESHENTTLQIGNALLQKDHQLTPELQGWADAINAQLAIVADPEIMLYVHGTKVDFLNSVAMTAEIDHFAGRDFVGIAFAWPSHQNILYYLSRTDVRRALASSEALQVLLKFLAEYTTAERINVLSYSAGARVVSKALDDLHSAHSQLDTRALRNKFRIGDVVFAAADVPVETFIERLPGISGLAEDVAVMVSDHDPALSAAERFMGHGLRAGTEAAADAEESLVRSLGITNFHVVDVSLDQQNRGFDIIGHHYWYRHPWASSDIILLMRTDLTPPRRGLSRSEFGGVYYLSDEYPDKVRNAALKELGGMWSGDSSPPGTSSSLAE